MAMTHRPDNRVIDLADHRRSRAEPSKLDFLASAVHELRGPVSLLVGCGETLRQLWDRPELAEHGPLLLDTMVGSGRRLLRLVNDLLTAAYLEHGDLPMRIEPTPILPILRWACESLGTMGATIEIDCPSELCVHADPDRLEQILVNLLANAVQHGVAPITVAATPSRDGTTVHIVVRDDGPGIDREQTEHLFEAFTPLATPSATSTGLGLAIARTLARAMHGDVTYERRDGSAFRLRLPVPPVT
jgi:signal transduction histidine kinase